MSQTVRGQRQAFLVYLSANHGSIKYPLDTVAVKRQDVMHFGMFDRSCVAVYATASLAELTAV